MWVKNEKSWILGVEIMRMQQSTVLCFIEVELVSTSGQIYEDVLIRNLDFFIRLNLSRIGVGRRRGEFELVFSPINLSANVFNVIMRVAPPVSQVAI
jgi:hypothetical protein